MSDKIEQRRSDAREAGPAVLRNWLAATSGRARTGGAEYGLYSDAWIVGELPGGLGPYALLNAIRFDGANINVPALFLRVDYHAASEGFRFKDKTDHTEFTGATLADELAALVSLCLGARVAAGEETRVFWERHDPLGRPRADDAPPAFALPSRGRRQIIPYTHGEKQLSPNLIATLGSVAPADAVVLVRAARTYRDALWIAESEPELAWLLLVAAVETAAVHYRASRQTPAVHLRDIEPEMAAALEALGPEVLSTAERHLARLFKAQARFLAFVADMDPPPPLVRPPPAFQFEWTRPNIEAAMKKVYGWRSKALHEGIPFPPPMCESPTQWEKVPGEKPFAMASASHGGEWVAKDTPMYLATFEHIARECLQRWWRSLVPKSGDPPTPAADA